MKREVWVMCEMKEGERFVTSSETRPGFYIQKQVIHESRWIPVSERMPITDGHYHVIRLDREDWCYCELVTFEGKVKPEYAFTSKGVTHWLEAPPLPVEEDGFEEWYKKKWNYQKNIHATKEELKTAWNAAKESK